MIQLSITTTQNVNINFTAASVGDRIAAQLLDTLVKAAYVISVFFILDYAGLSDSLEFLLDNLESKIEKPDEFKYLASRESLIQEIDYNDTIC